MSRHNKKSVTKVEKSAVESEEIAVRPEKSAVESEKIASKPELPIAESVMKQIKTGKVAMRPRIFFLLITALSVVITVFASISLTYLMSILSLWWRVQTSSTMAWGARANLSEAIASFPWWVLAVTLVALAAAIWLIKRQGMMYRHKTVTIALIIFMASLLFALIASALNIDVSGGYGSGMMNSGSNSGANSDSGSGSSPGWRRGMDMD